ncbi:MAG: hypothetical protein ACR2OG_15310 [Gemmatimonadaceae bacterium]
MSSLRRRTIRKRAVTLLRTIVTVTLLLRATPGWAQLDSALSRADSLAAGLNGGARHRVSVLGGYQAFAASSALHRSPFLGMRLDRPLGALEIGGNIAFSRPLTRGEYFPWNRQIYFSDAAHLNDTTLLFAPNQYTTLVTTSLDLNLVLGTGGSVARGLVAELGAGGGYYNFWLDPEQAHGNSTMGGPLLTFGAGLGVPLGASYGLRLRVDDVVLSRFDRNRFSLADPLFAEDLFVNPVVAPPRAQRTVHNVRYAIGLIFVPRARAR